jgi:hypothetical protein
VEEGGGGGVRGSGCAWQGKREGMGSVLPAGAAGQKREGQRASMSTGHGGGEVAVGNSSGGRGARGKGQQRRGAGPGKGESDAWSPLENEVAPGRS